MHRRWPWAAALSCLLHSEQNTCNGDTARLGAHNVNTFGELDLKADPVGNDDETISQIGSILDGGDNESVVDLTIAEVNPSLECGIWLAPSALAGAGLGMYAGKAFKEGEPLQQVGDLCIPIVDIQDHNMKESFTFLWDQYTWSASSLGMETEGQEVNGASPGFGSAANSFLPLVNVDELKPRRDVAGLHRSKDPGVGAFTPYYDRGSTATRDIEAGEELYVSYGESWFEGREYLGPIPLRKDHDRASSLFRSYLNLKSRLTPSVPASLLDDVWDDFVRNSAYSATSRVFGSFHHNDKEELTRLEKVRSVSELRRREAIRTQEWLERHGTCGDHLRAGPSTIPQAGHGGFASRNLPSGTIVAQIPLIHITNRTRFNMYHFSEKDPNHPEALRPPQLLLNYCFGHNESSLLLCPYGPMVNYINHNQSLANVKIQWADPKRGNFMPHLLTGSVQALDSDATAKLAFELVTTRSIGEGEEVFLDYGDEWEQAWQRHIESWNPVDGAAVYQSADELNEALKTQQVEILTEFEELEQKRLAFPTNVDLVCNDFFSDDLWIPGYENGTMNEELQKWTEDSGEMWYCSVLRTATSRVTGGVLYTVEARNDEDTVHYVWEGPYEMFGFLDKAYSTDLHLDNAFRHDIRIPDALFPDPWRNLAPGYEGESIVDDHREDGYGVESRNSEIPPTTTAPRSNNTK